MKPKIILFDWDGTLADASHIAVKAMNATRVHRGEVALEGREALNESAKALPLMFPDPVDQQYFIESHARISAVMPPAPMPGADEMVRYLNKLRPHGLYVGIISNKPSDIIRREMKPFGWDGMFEIIVGPTEVVHAKPHPASLAKVLESYPDTISPRDILYLGDSNTDAQFARNCGVRFLGVGHGITEPLEVQQHCVDIHAAQRRLRMVLAERKNAVEI